MSKDKATQKKVDAKTSASNTSKESRVRSEDSQWCKGKAIAPYYHTNDGSWYTMGATMSPNILNWNTKLTDPTDLSFNAEVVKFDNSFVKEYTPGVCVLRFVPIMGKLSNFHDAMNVAARGLHTYIWHKATRTTQYDPADLMMYCGLADSLNAFYGLMCRLYGLLPTYGYTNAYYPEAIIQAQGFDPVDLRNHMAEFRMYINMYARKIGRFAVPASLPIFKRHNYLCSNVFKDDDDESMYQTYVPMPVGFYRFDTDSNGWGMMKFVPLPTATGGLSYAELISYGDTLIDSWEYNTDLNAMSADVLQAFGAENCWGVSTIAEDYRTTPVYDEAFMMQTDNMDFLGAPDYTDNHFDVFQSIKGVLQQTLVCNNAELKDVMQSTLASGLLYTSKKIIWNKPVSTLEDVMELTRGVNFPRVLGSNDVGPLLAPTYAGTELWTTIKLVTDVQIGGVTTSFFHRYQGTGYLDLTARTGVDGWWNRIGALLWLNALSSFKHHPGTRGTLFVNSTTIASTIITNDNRDLRHWAGLTVDQMRQINEQAVFSEWNVAKSNFVNA